METISKQPEPSIDEENKVKDKELLAKVREAYKQMKTKDIRVEELCKWLRENGLTQEESEKAIHTAIKHRKIRFCYTSKTPEDRGKLVPYYERITKRDEFPPEVDEEMWKHIIRQDPRILLGVKSKTRDTNKDNKEEKHRVVKGTASIEDTYICIDFESQDSEELRKMKESIEKLGKDKITTTDEHETTFKAKINKRDRKIATSILKHAGEKEKIDSEITAERRVLDHLRFKKWWRID